MIATLLVGLALAGPHDGGPRDDLTRAAEKGLSDGERKEAFNRLVHLGSTDMGWVSEVAIDDQADARERWVAIRAIGKIGGDRARTLLGLGKGQARGN